MKTESKPTNKTRMTAYHTTTGGPNSPMIGSLVSAEMATMNDIPKPNLNSAFIATLRYTMPNLHKCAPSVFVKAKHVQNHRKEEPTIKCHSPVAIDPWHYYRKWQSKDWNLEAEGHMLKRDATSDDGEREEKLVWSDGVIVLLIVHGPSDLDRSFKWTSSFALHLHGEVSGLC